MFIFSFLIMFILTAPYNEMYLTSKDMKLNQESVTLENTQTLSQINFLIDKNVSAISPIVLDGSIKYYISNEIEKANLNIPLYKNTSKILFLSAYYIYFKTRIHCWGEVYNCYTIGRENCFNNFLFCNLRARRYKVKPPIALTRICTKKNLCNVKDLKELKRAYNFLTVNSFPNTKLAQE